jgi:hypothetical protein
MRTTMSTRLGWLGLVRVLFGALVLVRTTPVLAPLHIPYLRATSPLLGWPSATWHVPMWGPALPAVLVAVMCLARTLAVLLFTVGIRARESGVAAGLLAWIVMSQDSGSYINTFHLLFLGMMVLGVSGAGSTCAVLPEQEVDPRSGLALTQAFVASVYAWSGFAKLNASWLSGEVLEVLRSSSAVRGPIAEAFLRSRGSCMAAAWTVAAAELALGPMLLWTRTRRVAWVAAFVFHAVLEISMHPDFFGFAMAVLLLSFAPPGAMNHFAVVSSGGGGGAVDSTGRQPPALQPPGQ